MKKDLSALFERVSRNWGGRRGGLSANPPTPPAATGPAWPFKKLWTGFTWLWAKSWPTLKKVQDFCLKTFKKTGSTTKKIALWCMLPLLVLLAVKSIVPISAWFVKWSGELGLADWKTVWVLVGIVGFLVLARIIQGGIHLPSSTTIGRAGRFFGFLKHPDVWQKIGIWVVIEGLVLAIAYKFWFADGDALWTWIKEWWLILLPIHVVIGFIVFRKDSGHGSHGHDGGLIEVVKSWLVILILIGVFALIFVGVKRLSTPAVYFEPGVNTVSPSPQLEVSPTDIRMGTWEISVAPLQWSDWIEYFSTHKTSWRTKSPNAVILVQKGKRVGREIVPSPDPPQKFGPNDPTIWMSAGYAVKITGWTNTESIIISRSFK
ncbi:MAG TPA: hypothetical protein VJI33_04660 [Candidatus Paceibacterota bacterium]